MGDKSYMAAPDRLLPADATPSLSPILVVDDSKAQRRLLTRALQKWGYETVEAASGKDALSLCEATNFDIIISDWMMPGMSGVEFCRAFRAMSGRAAFFLLLTAQTESEILAEGLESGADDFLSKPFHAVELRARLRAGRRSVQAQRALADQNLTLSQTLDELSDAYAAIERDLKGARVFQEGLLPERFVSFQKVDVSLLFRSSGHVGGDLVGFFPVCDDEIGVFSVDVSGHGVASALMTARIASYLNAATPDRNIALRESVDGYEMAPLQETCARLNTILMQDTDSDQYLTMAIARVNVRTGVVNMCLAGHPSPALQRANGTVEFIELWSTPIGLIEDGDFSETEVELAKGDRIIFYSDGVTECPDQNDVLLDESGFADLLSKTEDMAGADLVEQLTGKLIAYRGSEDFPDDISAVVVEVP
ncbi:MAG: SpoIIE family protein phosphatase [Pseudomonadota bacterium]